MEVRSPGVSGLAPEDGVLGEGRMPGLDEVLIEGSGVVDGETPVSSLSRFRHNSKGAGQEGKWFVVGGGVILYPPLFLLDTTFFDAQESSDFSGNFSFVPIFYDVFYDR